MAKYTVAVCDDEKEDLSFLVRKITEYDTHQLFEIKTYTDLHHRQEPCPEFCWAPHPGRNEPGR